MGRPTSSGTQKAAADPGALVRHWRTARGKSQMDLALEADISPRHMSFVETGRSRASRKLLIRLAASLGIPSREENVLLEAAGYARRISESHLSDPDMAQVRKVLRFLLDRHEPNSALVFDRHWNIVMSNNGHRATLEFFLAGRDVPAEVRGNLLRLTYHPTGLRPHIANWDVVGPTLLARVEQESADAPSDFGLASILEEIRTYGPVPQAEPEALGRHRLLLPVRLRRDRVDVRLISVLSTIGAAMDLTVMELRIESFFPSDEESERQMTALREMC